MKQDMTGKKEKERKRHLMVDTQGFVLGVQVRSAAQTDRQATIEVLENADSLLISQLKQIYADGAYCGKLISQIKKQFGIILSIVKKKTKAGFKVVPKRWVEERTFAWITKCRRLTIDYERLPDTPEAFIIFAMSRLMLNHY